MLTFWTHTGIIKKGEGGEDGRNEETRIPLENGPICWYHRSYYILKQDAMFWKGPESSYFIYYPHNLQMWLHYPIKMS